MELFIHIIVLLISSILIILKLISNSKSKKRAKGITSILEDESDAFKFSQTLEILILKDKNIDLDIAKRRLDSFKIKKLKYFTINLLKKIDLNTYIITTLCEYNKSNDSKIDIIFLDLNFKIILDLEDYSLLIYSDLFDDLVGKTLRKEFANKLVEELNNRYY